MLLPTKRRRLFGKQAAANLLVAQEPLDVPPVSEELLPLVPGEALLPEAGNEAAEPTSRFDFLNQKTISSLVLAVLQSKTDQELHTLQVKTVLADVLAKSDGKINERELTEKRDDFIAACMKLVPRELSRRLLTAVCGKPATAETDVKVSAIDQKTWQKSYLITISGLGASTAPSHEEIKDSMLNSFRNAGFSNETKVTHLGIFRECHRNGDVHYHVCANLSERCRWLPWKKALAEQNISAHFSQVQLEGMARQRKLQYQCMLRYCFVPTAHKPLASLDPEPLLFHCGGMHPPLLDAIQGELDAEAVNLSLQDQFLQRAQAGRHGPTRFLDSCTHCYCRFLFVPTVSPLVSSKRLIFGVLE